MAVFAILKYAGRCGSHWMKSCMSSHPDVFMLRDEQFDLEKINWRCRKRWSEMVAAVFDTLGNDDSQGCLVKAGFVGNLLWRPLREEIARVPGIHIILNSRRDYLAQYISLAVASITGQFSSFLEPIEAQPFELDHVRMLKSFENWDKKTDLYGEIFAGLPLYHFYYEDMEDNLDEIVREIYRFIGVDDSHKPTFTTKKQRLKTAREMILNYDVVVGVMKESPWANCLSANLD